MATVVPAASTSKVFYQDGSTEFGAEPAILITSYDDVVLLEVADNEIRIGRNDIDDFIKELRKILKTPVQSKS